MTVFTIIGVLWFWMFCWEIGRGLGWLTEHGVVKAVFAVFVTITGIEHAVEDVLNAFSVEGKTE